MSRRKIGAALKRICDYEGIVLSRDEIKFHIDRLISENIPIGLSDDGLDEIVLDYLKDEKVLTA
ncbi:MAG: hypothetical protein ACK5VA_05660 [Pseudanabaena sp.]|jgi:hypothetical protein|uniref:hypothetical protein n=1 Tax=Bacteria TaxID=2 RepID=UPI0022BBA1B3|nr:hypothetical protein [Microcystis sp. LE19-41.2A]MCZ8050212.1 hypothetical protein [Microcystis sp. LE19-41.2A]MCZ8283588.1 hypothetical protein [Aquidulcibacter sp.]NCR83010.1 hypothetical protein [Microcystis aeruginosa K13-10]NCR87701.1 hypothetical protein [Microcystis aeruginosa K13-05]